METKDERYKRLMSNPIYSYLTRTIWTNTGEIDSLKGQIKGLARKQEELKRGRSYMIELRRELVKTLDGKK
jgi:hypothetical protein